jgi:hypothetical protein
MKGLGAHLNGIERTMHSMLFAELQDYFDHAA